MLLNVLRVFLMDICHMKVSLKPGALDEKLGWGQCFLMFFEFFFLDLR